ncbi:hypothetical protein [Streptomyces endophyticus]|uniref:Alkaline shock response membrane anchor protein AmaP n=1 Tax=Streptomyces endophyticus TaxID=714166 RepID=A0ABU6F120_9ACTN|nr:hypothetical protein [Streptomyces endophyticus]MEB8337564.1 hypothetical protein [Streptomyces endophyticus]
MPRSRTLLNRIALALCGLVAVAVGGWLCSGRTSWRSTVPERWSALGAHTPLVPAERLASLRGQEWWTPTVMAAAAAATVLLAWWGARQLRTGSRRLVALPTSRSHLRTRALEDTLAALVEDVDGVAHCRSRVRGGTRTDRLDAVLRVRLHHDTTPSTVLPPLTRIASDTGDALDPYRFHMHIRFSARSHRRPHVR